MNGRAAGATVRVDVALGYDARMLDHVSQGASDLARAAAFYDAALGALGYVRLFANGVGCHVAFAAPSREAVDAFHAAAIRMGATDEGAPGLRPHYGAGYYAAFVRDLDGYRVEAVFHERTAESLRAS